MAPIKANVWRMNTPAHPMSILFASPTYWPAVAFGGPTWMARELNQGMVARGHAVGVLTTSIVDLHDRGSLQTTSRVVDGVAVRYLSTPIRYRWMGITPTLPWELHKLERPDVAHVFGYRDVVTTAVATWCRRREVPYVFEPLGMYKPKLRKVALKRLFDATVVRNVADSAAWIVATSEFERGEMLEVGADPARVVIRGNGFPQPMNPNPEARAELRRRLGIERNGNVVLYVGRIAAGKGIEHLIAATRLIPEIHLVLAGPDDRHGVARLVDQACSDPRTAGRVHRLQATVSDRPFDLYAAADLFVLPSAGESFGMVAAEAAASGTPVIVTDRCGVADVLAPRGALVVPYDHTAIMNAILRVIHDPQLAAALANGGRQVAHENSWERIVEIQEGLYFDAVDRGGRR